MAAAFLSLKDLINYLQLTTCKRERLSQCCLYGTFFSVRTTSHVNCWKEAPGLGHFPVLLRPCFGSIYVSSLHTELWTVIGCVQFTLMLHKLSELSQIQQDPLHHSPPFPNSVLSDEGSRYPQFLSDMTTHGRATTNNLGVLVVRATLTC